MQVVSHIPVGWNPSAVAFSPDGKILYVVNTKGKGAGPNAGTGHDPKTPTYVGSLELGSVSAIPLDSLPAAGESTKSVIAANTAAVANRPPLPHLKHCFLVIRENRTYDEVLGDVAGANGDPPWPAMAWTDGRLKKNPRPICTSRPTSTRSWPGSP